VAALIFAVWVKTDYTKNKVDKEAVMSNKKQACADDWVEVTKADLPLSCPRQDQHVMPAHPAVYLPLEASGKAKCYYCGTVYVLKDFADVKKS
jgi:uncharacterized Zn-finger protein